MPSGRVDGGGWLTVIRKVDSGVEGQGMVMRLSVFICSGVKRICGRVYGYVFPLLLLQKYTGKWGHTLREMDRWWNDWDGFTILIIIL